MRRFFWILFLVLDVVLLVSFSMGYMARYIRPGWLWWTELIATGLPYLALGVLLALVPLFLARRWRLVFLHLGVLLLVLVRFGFRGDAPEGAALDEQLTVLTFNTSRGGGATAEAQGEAVTQLALSERPHLACFQDLHLNYDASPNHTGVNLAALIDSLDYTVVGPTHPDEALHAWQPVLARVPVLSHKQVLIPDANGGPATRIVRVHFTWHGREAVLYNLHLRSFGSQKPWTDTSRDPLSWSFWKSYLQQYRSAYFARAEEVNHIRAMLDEETLPVILCGDFNSTAHNSAFGKLAHNRQDAFREAGQGLGATYHAQLPFARIDHILVSNDWEVLEAEVGQSSFSDHLPLTVKLRWRE